MQVVCDQHTLTAPVPPLASHLFIVLHLLRALGSLLCWLCFNRNELYKMIISKLILNSAIPDNSEQINTKMIVLGRDVALLVEHMLSI